MHSSAIMSSKSRIKIKHSVVIVVGSVSDEKGIAQLVESFDIADKTPTDCFDFIRKLKSLLKH